MTAFYSSSASDEWYTPSRYVEAAREVMGDIDLDPASCEQAQETVQAARYFTEADDGLAQPWAGRIFLNPPYSRGKCRRFIEKLVAAYAAGEVTEAIVLVADSTETAWFQPLYDYMLCFHRGRIRFESPVGTKPHSTFGSVFVYMGPNEDVFVGTFSRFGRIVRACDLQIENSCGKVSALGGKPDEIRNQEHKSWVPGKLRRTFLRWRLGAASGAQ